MKTVMGSLFWILNITVQLKIQNVKPVKHENKEKRTRTFVSLREFIITLPFANGGRGLFIITYGRRKQL
jgi:hypothetical protein